MKEGKDKVKEKVTSVNTTSKASKNKSISWTKLGLKIISAETKLGLVRRISTALTKGANVGRHFLVGFNSINRTLESSARSGITSEICKETREIESRNTCMRSEGNAPSSVNDEAKLVTAICVCRDSPILLQNRIVEAAFLQKVPVIIVPAFTDQLAALLKLKRANCFAILNNAKTSEEPCASPEKNVTNSGVLIVNKSCVKFDTLADISSQDMLTAALDDLREHVLQLASKEEDVNS